MADLAFQDGGAHTVQHLELLAQNPLRQTELKEMNEQMGEIMKFADQLNQAAQEQREKEASENPEGDAWLAKIQERLNISFKDMPPDSKSRALAMMGLPSEMESPVDANLRIKQEQLDLKKNKQAVDTAKTQQGMALSDVETSLNVLDHANNAKAKQDE
jgi:Asp-tRNA(Asn)/Glu-tRNA(Gln) amidotransferase C subunit